MHILKKLTILNPIVLNPLVLSVLRRTQCVLAKCIEGFERYNQQFFYSRSNPSIQIAVAIHSGRAGNLIAILILLSTFYTHATMINRSIIQKDELTVQEELNNSGAIAVEHDISLYASANNSGSITAEKLFLNGSFTNTGTLNVTKVFTTADCNRFENQGTLNIEKLYLPAYGTYLKLRLNKQTTIGALYRGQDFLGGISYEPQANRGKITITDELGEQHVFAQTAETLENILEKLLNEKVSVIALITSLQKMTKKS